MTTSDLSNDEVKKVHQISRMQGPSQRRGKRDPKCLVKSIFWDPSIGKSRNSSPSTAIIFKQHTMNQCYTLVSLIIVIITGTKKNKKYIYIYIYKVKQMARAYPWAFREFPNLSPRFITEKQTVSCPHHFSLNAIHQRPIPRLPNLAA
jgi:hypothetical protein